MLKCLLVLLFVHLTLSHTVVWDYYLDYCFAKVPPENRPRARCEDVPGVTAERHYLNNYYFWCITVNNTDNKFKELIVEMNEPRIFNETKLNINYLKTLELESFKSNYDRTITVDIPKGLKFVYEITPNYFVVGFKLQNALTTEYRIDRIVSLQIDGMESCNASRRDEPDTLLPIREPPVKIPNRFLKHCLELNLNRAEPEPGFCENVAEVIVRKYLLNNQIPFWCVTVNPKMNTDIAIEMDGTNNELEYNSGQAAILKSSELGKYLLNTEHHIVIAIQPQILVLPVLNITSLRINGLESCGILLEQTVCGEPEFTIRSLIANGEFTQPGQYPWHTAVFEKQIAQPLQYLCGGSIIGKNVILTAGHCVSGLEGIRLAKALVIKAGLNDLNTLTNLTQEIQVSKIILHDDFDINYLEHDIAILKLIKFIEYNSFVQPICLAQNSESNYHIVGIVPGWGRNEKHEKQNLLSAASLPLINENECRRSNRDFYQQFLNQWKFCAGYRNGTAICTGDSGGGFAVKYLRRWYLRGIVSLGVSERGFCALNEYVLFTDVAQYFKWIKSKLNL